MRTNQQRINQLRRSIKSLKIEMDECRNHNHMVKLLNQLQHRQRSLNKLQHQSDFE